MIAALLLAVAARPASQLTGFNPFAVRNAFNAWNVASPDVAGGVTGTSGVSVGGVVSWLFELFSLLLSLGTVGVGSFESFVVAGGVTVSVLSVLGALVSVGVSLLAVSFAGLAATFFSSFSSLDWQVAFSTLLVALLIIYF